MIHHCILADTSCYIAPDDKHMQNVTYCEHTIKQVPRFFICAAGRSRAGEPLTAQMPAAVCSWQRCLNQGSPYACLWACLLGEVWTAALLEAHAVEKAATTCCPPNPGADCQSLDGTCKADLRLYGLYAMYARAQHFQVCVCSDCSSRCQ